MRGIRLSSLNMIGVLLVATVVALNSVQGLRCQSCVYGKGVREAKEFGDASCKAGLGHQAEECNEDTILPVSKLNPSAPQLTLGDLRRRSADPKLSSLDKTVYACAMVEIKSRWTALRQPLYFITRSCAFEPKGKPEECKTKSEKEFRANPTFPVEKDASLGDNAQIRVCACYKDECSKPEAAASFSAPPSRMMIPLASTVWIWSAFGAMYYILLEIY